MNSSLSEIEKFNQLAHQWWDRNGLCRALHDLNPTRLQFISDRCVLNDLKVLDLGCGGGILTESLALKRAEVTGIDLSPNLIQVAKKHAKEKDLAIDYIESSAEEHAQMFPHYYDVVCCMELVEHVDDPISLLQSSATLLKPGGHLFLSTLNRTFKAYLVAILGAEYLLRLLPKQTHDYEKFVKPFELNQWLNATDMTLEELKGISYNPFLRQSQLTNELSINYLAHATKDHL